MSSLIDLLDSLVTLNKATSLAGDGRKTVTTAATRERLTPLSVPAVWVIITAETDNADKAVVGASTVVAALATRRGIALDAGDSIMLYVKDLKDIWLDVLVSGEGVTYVWGV